MNSVSPEQVRMFRLHTHHLDTWYQASALERVVGACGLQNTPPGAWETALHNRIPSLSLDAMQQLLEVDKTLLQAWSFRGTPVVFPTTQSDVFLSALIARTGEPWIYTRGIQLALEYLDMAFDELLQMLILVMPKLDGQTIRTKELLDQTLAGYMLPLLPDPKKDLWNKPSMYGNPDKQTVGGAVVSFLLRPCSCLGWIVFGKREGASPTFTSYDSWVGHPLDVAEEPERKLVRRFLHCYGPSSVTGLADWLGCSPQQAKRMWRTVADEIEPVMVEGRKRSVLAADKELLSSPPQPQRQLHLLGGHDPYLGLQDRAIILQDKARQKQIWQTVANPGAVLWHGEVVGFWKSRKKGRGLEVEATLWDAAKQLEKELRNACEPYAAFRQLALSKVEVIS